MNAYDAAKVLRAVVEHGSLVAAAQHMGISASAVSKQIAYLEAQLGVQLLRRTTRKVQVTEQGRIFYEQSSHIHAQWDQLLNEVQHGAQVPCGKVRIAAPDLVCSRWLAPIVSKMQNDHPKLNIALQAEPFANLPVHGADISICRQIPRFNSASYKATKLVNYRNQLYAAPDYLQRRGIPKTLQDLNRHSCLFYGLGSTVTDWHFCDGQQFFSSGALTTNSTEVLIQWVLNGAGIAMLPTMLIQKELKCKNLVPVLAKRIGTVQTAFAYHQKVAFPSPTIKWVLDQIKLA